jgi:aminopeptidase N
MLYNLQYVLGDSLFLAAMQNYFDEWKIAHPYIEDFRNSIINFTHVDLNWFFDEWFETNKSIDYGIKKVKRKKNAYEITLKRYERMQMPIDLRVTFKNDSVAAYHIPNDWFVKQTSATVLPKWFGWDNLHETYRFTIPTKNKIKQIELDTTQRLADINRIDNQWKKKCKWYFDYALNQPNDWQHIVNYVRPDVWYNQVDGVKLGVNINGSYVENIHKYSLSAWYNSFVFSNQDLNTKFVAGTLHKSAWVDGLMKHVNYNFSYQSLFKKLSGKSDWYIKSSYLEGMQSYKLGITTVLANNRTSIELYQKAFKRNAAAAAYLIPTAMDDANWNSYVCLSVMHKYFFAKGNGTLKANLRLSSIGSDTKYAVLQVESKHSISIHKFDLSTRMMAQYSSNALPSQSALYLAGANPEEMYDNKYVRSNIYVPSSAFYASTTGHFQFGGGLNLRGYNSYLTPYTDKSGNQIYMFIGNTGAAINAELAFDKYIKWKVKKLNWLKVVPYLFMDAGTLTLGNDLSKFTPVRMDAGIGSTFTIKRWWVLDKAKPLTLRIDLPLFLNTPPYAEGKYVKMRWLFGIERAF